MGLRTFSQPGSGFIREDGHHIPVTVDAKARDAGHVGHETHLRAGLAMAKVTASGRYKEYNDANADGTEVFVGYLYAEVDVTIGGKVDEADVPGVLLVTGVVDESKVIGIDAAGKADVAGQIFHV